MTTRPILFSGPMVRALLDGRKTQTRRVLKPQPPSVEAVHDMAGIGYDWHPPKESGSPWRPVGPVWAVRKMMGREPSISLPYAPGDLLWVREAWAQHHPAGVQRGRFSIAGTAGIPGPPSVKYRVIYRADGDPERVWHCIDYPYRTTDGPRDEIDAKHPDVCSEFPGWHPSIHMPRWASRLTLRVTDVRVQRVQEITNSDAVAEGIERVHEPQEGFRDYSGSEPVVAMRPSFRTLWDRLNAPRGYGWDANPWCAAYTFEVIRQNVDEV
ncbi:MAG: hypothetical protein VX874_15675 [Pseudomonadota bacterium]|nr:hypothetical protein [Pseudomonadota bacterium]